MQLIPKFETLQTRAGESTYSIEYHALVLELARALQPFEPMDYRAVLGEYYKNAELQDIEAFSRDQALALLIASFRIDRFCDGHLAKMVSDAKVLGALYRLQRL